jgi:HEAT repeat protein
MESAMQKEKSHNRGQPYELCHASGCVGDAILEVHKALKAIAFYPENHPLRNDIVRRAFDLLVSAMGGKDLSLLVTRNGLASTAGGPPLQNTPAVKSLARELFAREIQRLSFLSSLSMKEFEDFLTHLTIDPQKILTDGGMEQILADRTITNIITNEIDISAVFTKLGVTDTESIESSQNTIEAGQCTVEFEYLPLDEMEDMEIEEVIAAMKREADDGRYARLAGAFLSKARALEAQGGFKELIPAVLFLISQSSDSSKSHAQRECAEAVFGSIAQGEIAHHLLCQVQDRECDSREIMYLILNRLGERAVEPAIQMLNKANDIHSRKALATALIRIGKPAVPSLTASLKDQRWYVVRGTLTILGEIRSTECIREVRSTIHHDDERVRKEAIRCLTKIGGPLVTELLVELLTDKNPSVQKQAIFSLGILKDERAVGPLFDVINRRDFFLKTLALKKEAVQAVGIIGAKKALPQLMKIAGKRHLLSKRRGEVLQVCAIEAIGRIGDTSSVVFLRKVSTRGGLVGEACSHALRSITRGDNHPG